VILVAVVAVMAVVKNRRSIGCESDIYGKKRSDKIAGDGD
jgi:hypothetical protein